MKTYRPGDLVSVDHPSYPGVWRVKKVNKVNSVLEREDGTGKSLSAPQSMLTDPNTAVVQAVPMPENYALGEFVRIETGKYAGLWVVIKDDGRDKVNLATPGGNGQHYLRATKRGLKRVELSQVPAEMVAMGMA